MPVDFVDERGSITNLLEVDIKHVSLIVSKSGAIRGNHFHKKDEHWTIIMSGGAMYYELQEGKIEEVQLNIYDMVFTPNRVAHAFWFRHPTIMLAFTTRKRNKGVYDKDTVKQVIFKHPLDRS